MRRPTVSAVISSGISMKNRWKLARRRDFIDCGSYARKNRKLLWAVAAFIALLVGGTVASTLQALRATRAEHSAERERDRAVSEKQRADEQAAVAKAVNDFLQNDLLAQASADKQAGPRRRPDPD